MAPKARQIRRDPAVFVELTRWNDSVNPLSRGRGMEKVTGMKLVLSFGWMIGCRNGRRPALHAVLTAALCVYLGPALSVSAMDFDLMTTLGYDDNAAFTDEPQGTGFARYQLTAGRSFATDDRRMDLTLYADGFFQDRFRLDDDYGFTAGASAWRVASELPMEGGLSVSGSVYRNDLDEEDDVDTLAVSGWLEWHALARLSLGLTGDHAALHYRSDWEVFREIETSEVSKAMETSEVSAGRGPHGPGGGPEPGFSSRDRDDRMTEGSVYGTLYLLPTLQARLQLGVGHLDSSIDAETHDHKKAAVTLTFGPWREWTAEGSLEWRELDYDFGRNDIYRAAGLQVSRPVGPVDVYFQLSGSDNDSDIDSEDYQRTVTQCGLSWSF